MADGIDIGDPQLLALLASAMSGTANTNLNVLGNLLGDGSTALPLSVLLGTSNVDSLAGAVDAASYRPVEAATLQAMDYESTLQNFAGDPETTAALQAVESGIPPETYVALQKAEIAGIEGITDEQRTAENFRIDALKPVLEVYKNQLDAYASFQGKLATGEVVERDGTFYQSMSPADRQAELSKQGIYGALADPSMYQSPQATALAAAERFLQQSGQQETAQKNQIWDQQVAGTRITPEQARQLTQLANKSSNTFGNSGIEPDPKRPWYKKLFDAISAPETIGAQSPPSDPDQMVPSGGHPKIVWQRNELSPEERSARAGMYLGQQNARAAAEAAKPQLSALEQLKLDNQKKYGDLLSQAASASTTRPAESYIANQSALLSALAGGSGSGGGSGGGGGVAAPKIRLDQDTIQRIVGALSR